MHNIVDKLRDVCYHQGFTTNRKANTMIVQDHNSDVFVVFIDGEALKQFAARCDAEAFEQYKLQGRKDTTRKQDVAYIFEANKPSALKDVRQFAIDNLEHAPDNVELKEDVYIRYQQTGGRLHRDAFFRTLKRVVSKRGLLVSKQIMRDGIRQRYVKGVKLK